MKLQLALGKHILCLGTNGSGKTNACVYLFQAFPKGIPCIWYDLEEDYDNISSICEITVNETDDLIQAIEDGHDKIHFMELQPFREQIFKRWNEICSIVFNLGNCVLLCDEIMRVCEIFGISDWHYGCLTRGRKRQITMIQASQRSQQIHKILVTESHIRIVFRLSDYDIQALSRWFGASGWLHNLPPFYFIYQDGLDASVMKPLPLVLPEKGVA